MPRPCRRVHPRADHGTAEFNLGLTPYPAPRPSPSRSSPSPHPAPPTLVVAPMDLPPRLERDPAAPPGTATSLPALLRALRAECRHLRAGLESSCGLVVNGSSRAGSLSLDAEARLAALQYLEGAECQVRAAWRRLQDLEVTDRTRAI